MLRRRFLLAAGVAAITALLLVSILVSAADSKQPPRSETVTRSSPTSARSRPESSRDDTEARVAPNPPLERTKNKSENGGGSSKAQAQPVANDDRAEAEQLAAVIESGEKAALTTQSKQPLSSPSPSASSSSESVEQQEQKSEQPPSPSQPVESTKQQQKQQQQLQQQKELSETEAQLEKQFVALHGQRVSLLALRRMCIHFRDDHQAFLQERADRQLELGIVFAANRLRSRFDTHTAEKRLLSTDHITCAHGVSIATSHDAETLRKLVSEAIEGYDKIRLHLLDLADGWTLTQTKDSDLVEEAVSSLAYYDALGRAADGVLQVLSFLRSGGALAAEEQKRCEQQVQRLIKLLGSGDLPEGTPNWTHMKVGVDMVLLQCDAEAAMLGTASPTSRAPNPDL